MAIHLKNAKTTASGVSSILSTLSGVALAFSTMPAESLEAEQLIGLGLMAFGVLSNAVGNIFAPDNSEVSVAVAEAKAVPAPAQRGFGR